LYLGTRENVDGGDWVSLVHNVHSVHNVHTEKPVCTESAPLGIVRVTERNMADCN
jgi:hypothetical protein